MTVCHEEHHVPAVTNIVKRPGSSNWYYRRAYPEDVQKVLGKREFWKSLGTSKLAVARTAATRAHFEFEQQVNAARRKVSPSEAQLDAQVAAFYRRELSLDFEQRNSGGEEGRFHVRYRGWMAPGHTKSLREGLATGETSGVDWAAEEIIRREGWLIEEGSTLYQTLCHKLMRAWLDAEARCMERDQGNFDGRPNDSYVAHVVAGASGRPGEAAGPATIMEVFERFAVDQRGQNADSLDKTRKIVRRFAEFVGPDEPVKAVTIENCREWKFALRAWPRKASETREFRGLDFKGVLEANRFLQKPVIGERTLASYLSAVGAFGTWLLANGYIDRHPVNGLLPRKAKGAERHPFTREALKRLFASPLLTRCAGDRREHEPGGIEIRDDRYWLFPLALCTGARLGELCQLRIRDLQETNGVAHLEITDEGEGQRVKTASSVRSVPLHPWLLRLGFVEHVKGLDRADDECIFTRWSRNARDQYGEASKWLNRYMERAGVKTDRSLTFHSLRHTFIDLLREAGVIEPEIKPIVGHSAHGVTRGYGKAQDVPLGRRAEIMDLLDLSFLSDACREGERN